MTEEDPLIVQVITTDLHTGVVKRRYVNHNHGGDRVWLGKHCGWSFRHHHSVMTTPLSTTQEDSFGYVVGETVSFRLNDDDGWRVGVIESFGQDGIALESLTRHEIPKRALFYVRHPRHNVRRSE